MRDHISLEISKSRLNDSPINSLRLAAHGELGQAAIQAVEEHARLAQLLTGDVAALATGTALGQSTAHLRSQAKLLARLDYVENRARANALHVFQIGAHVAAIGVWRVRALGAKIVELLVVRIQDNLLFVRIFERLCPRNDLPDPESSLNFSDHRFFFQTNTYHYFSTAFLQLGRRIRSSHYRRASTESRNVTAQHIHEDRFRHIVGIVTRHNHVETQSNCGAIESLTSEDAAEGAVVLQPDLLDNLVHSPAVELSIGENGERHRVLLVGGVSPNRRQRVVAIAADAFVDRDELELESVAMAIVERTHEACQDGRVFAARCADADAHAGAKERRVADDLVHFAFECGEEAALA